MRYRRPVYPGDQVVIEAKVQRLRSRMGVLKGVATVDGKVVVEGTMTFALGPAAPAQQSIEGVAPRYARGSLSAHRTHASAQPYRHFGAATPRHLERGSKPISFSEL